VHMHTMKAYGGLEEHLHAFLTSTVGGGDLFCIPATLKIGKQPPAGSTEEVAGWSPELIPRRDKFHTLPLWGGLVAILTRVSLLLR